MSRPLQLALFSLRGLFGLLLELFQDRLFLFVLFQVTRCRLPEHEASEDQQDPSEDELKLVQRDHLRQLRPNKASGNHGKTDRDAQLPADKLDLGIIIDAACLREEHRGHDRSSHDSVRYWPDGNKERIHDKPASRAHEYAENGDYQGEKERTE